jgi:GNAT superfamily N-acetyltransferase
VAVRTALDDDVEALVAMLCRAFADDPIVSFLFPGDSSLATWRRHGGLAAFFRTQLRGDLLGFGGVHTTDDHAGVAAWAPPGKPFATGLAGIVSVLPVLPYVLGGNTLRALRFLSVTEKVHGDEPHWYLATLGTEPARQSQGIGSALVAPVLERCDREGVPARLESSNPRNIPFYARQGFEVVDEVSLGPKSPVLTVMRRAPRA